MDDGNAAAHRKISPAVTPAVVFAAVEKNLPNDSIILKQRQRNIVAMYHEMCAEVLYEIRPLSTTDLEKAITLKRLGVAVGKEGSETYESHIRDYKFRLDAVVGKRRERLEKRVTAFQTAAAAAAAAAVAAARVLESTDDADDDSLAET